jgi:hypothetical protein
MLAVCDLDAVGGSAGQSPIASYAAQVSGAGLASAGSSEYVYAVRSGSGSGSRWPRPPPHADDRAAVVHDGDVLRSQELCAGVGAFVFACQVHAEEHTAHLCPGLALLELVLTDSFRVPDAPAGSELQQRSGLKPAHARWCRRDPCCGRCSRSPRPRARGCQTHGADVWHPGSPALE